MSPGEVGPTEPGKWDPAGPSAVEKVIPGMSLVPLPWGIDNMEQEQAMGSSGCS